MTVYNILQSFAPNYIFEETIYNSLDPNIQITNYVFATENINILTFTVRLNKHTGSIEFKIDSTGQKYIASNLNDKKKISDFISHLLVLENDLIKIYSILAKKLTGRPSNDCITTYYLFNGSTENTGTIQIKNGIIMFEYNQITKYTYSSIDKLLANPLIKQFKKLNFWFWS